MNALINKFSSVINGFITGFDRIVFKDWMRGQTSRIIQDAERFSKERCGQEISHISSSRLRKESLAHDHQKRNNIGTGLIGVWSAVESCVFYRLALVGV